MTDPPSFGSSWGSTLDGEIQRELILARTGDGSPPTIGRFIVEKVVGAGASAVVYATRDPVLDRRVAIKILAPPQEGRLAEASERSIREARALAHLSHRNIVSIYEVGQWKDRPFIAMELIEGKTLRAWLADEARPVAEILGAFLQAGRGLAAAHAQGHVHRDFKPANVLVATDGRVVVSDFGLASSGGEEVGCTPTTNPDPELAPLDGGAGDHARLADERVVVSAEGSEPDRPAPRPLGTPAYAAPEQRAGVTARPTADVYSFALSLVEALLGSHPMPQTSNAWRPALRAVVPRRLYRELCGALVSDPVQRTASLAPLLEALAACSPARRHARRRVLAIALGALALGLLLAIAISASLWRGEQPRARSQVPPIADASPGTAGAPGPDVRAGLDEPLLPRPVVLARRLTALLETPPEKRDERWRSDARATLLMPVPAEIRCAWPAPPRSQVILDDHVLSLDGHGEVSSCELASGAIARLAGGVRCLQPDTRNAVALVFADALEVWTFAGGSWATERVAPLPASIAGYRGASDVDQEGHCAFDVSLPEVANWQISLATKPAFADELSIGTRRLVRTASNALWLHATKPGGAEPRLLSNDASRFRIDDRMQVIGIIEGSGATLYELATGRVIRERSGDPPDRLGRRIEIARNGESAVSGQLDGPLKWWRRGDTSWREIPVNQAALIQLSISPDGRYALLVGQSGSLQAVEPAAGRRFPLADAQVRHARFVGGEHVVALDDTGKVWRWSLAQLRSFVIADHPGTGSLWGLTVSPDGEVVASSSSSREDGVIRLSSTRGDAQRTLRMAPGTGVHALRFAGQQLMAGSNDGTLHIWRWPSLERLAERSLPRDAWVWSLALAQPRGAAAVEVIGTGHGSNPDGKKSPSRVLVAHGGPPRVVFTARVGGNTGVADLAISPDSRTAAAVTSGGELALLSLPAGKVVRVDAHVGESRQVRFLEDGRRVLTVGDDEKMFIWSLNGEKLSEIFVDHGKIYDLELRGDTALLGTSDGCVMLWDLRTQKEVRGYDGHSAAISVARIDASGRWILSGDLEGRMCVHELANQACHTELLGHAPGKVIRRARFLADGRIATSSDDGTVRLWSPPYALTDDELVCELARRAFSPAGAAQPTCTTDGRRAYRGAR